MIILLVKSAIKIRTPSRKWALYSFFGANMGKSSIEKFKFGEHRDNDLLVIFNPKCGLRSNCVHTFCILKISPEF